MRRTVISNLSLTPTLVYNSALAKKAYTVTNTNTANTTDYTGFGFKLNICETVIAKTYTSESSGTTKTYYIYADADGTEHGFVKMADIAATDTTEAYTLYVDEDGLQKYMFVFDSRIDIYDDSKLTRSFTKYTSAPSGTSGGWYLTSITDQNGNKVSFTYDSNKRPTSVSVTPVGSSKIEMLTLSYYSTGKLMMVLNTVSNDAVIFRYASTYSGTANTTSQNYLIEVVRAKGTSAVTSYIWQNYAKNSSTSANITVVSSANIMYNSSGLISRIINSPSGRIISHSWSSSKVTGISEAAHSTATLGQSISISYGVGYTDVTSSGTDDIPNNDDDTVMRYVLDNYGRCVSTYTFHKGGSEIYGASFGSYESQEEVKNNLKEQYSLGGSVVNYLLNGSFDKAGSSSRVFANWYNNGAVSRGAAEIGRELDYYAAFAPTNGATAYINQLLTLAPGDYTLSFLYTVGNADGILGTASLKASDSQAYNQSEIIMLNEAPAQGVIGSDSTAMSFCATFTVPQSGNYELEIRFAADGSVTSSPNIRVYKVMLENSIGASAYTLVSYGGFEASGRESSSQVPLSQYWTNQSGSAPAVVESEAPFGKSVKVDVASTESVVSEAYVKQRVYDLSSVMTNTNRLDYIDYVAKKYIVSGFGKATDATISADSAFEIRVDVIYSMGSGSSDITVSHHFPFVSTCRGWQFVSGSFETIDQTNDLICVKAIDIYLVYSGQPNSGYALFDNISLVSADSTDLVEYEYYTEGDAVGLLKQKETFFYTEYYEYEGRNLTRIADDSGNLTDYEYDSCDRVIESYTGTFLYNSGHIYPINGANPNHTFTITYETQSRYYYNAYGLYLGHKTCGVRASGSWDGSPEIDFDGYEYVTTSGSRIFGAMICEVDDVGSSVRYFYDSKDGRLLATVSENEGNGVCYTYDEKGRLSAVTPASLSSSGTSYSRLTGQESVEYSYDHTGLLSQIETESTVYSFTYDIFGNADSVSVGSATLAEYEYNPRNGKLKSVSYGNGYKEIYYYNALELLEKVCYTVDNGEEQTAYEYSYTAYGELYRFDDHVNGRTTSYRYDVNGRLIGFYEGELGDNENYYYSTVTYNEKGELYNVKASLELDCVNPSAKISRSETYTYLDDGKLRNVIADFGDAKITESYTYDKYDRVVGHGYGYASGSPITGYSSSNAYTFTVPGDEYTTSLQIESHTSTVNGVATTYVYSYDGTGNIIGITVNGTEIRYAYDDIGQLVREDNGLVGKTYLYTYDNAGNITSVKEYPLTAEGATPSGMLAQKTYGYTDAAWGDLLTSFGGNAITYDGIGNPLSYYNGATFGWFGRQLVGATYNGKTMSFTYNDEGIRTSKTVDGVVTTYYLEGSRIIAEETAGNVTVYFYDTAGSVLGMRYLPSGTSTWQIYWFEHNLQGDVVAVYDTSGTKLVSYTYDAWGNTVTTQHATSIPTPVQNNPYRYRGYYFDIDLNLYYLNARYYDQHTGRFISADEVGIIAASPTGLTDKNLYAYCDNNPVARVDGDGEFWETAFDVISLGVSIAEVCINPTDPWAWAGLVGDVVDLIPFVTGVGEVTDLIRLSTKVDDLVDAVDGVYDSARAVDKISDGIDGATDITKTVMDVGNGGKTAINGIKYTDKVVKQMKNTRDLKHSFPIMIDNFVDLNNASIITGNDGVQRYLVQIPGNINKMSGAFEYIIDFNGWCNHRFFKEFKK